MNWIIRIGMGLVILLLIPTYVAAQTMNLQDMINNVETGGILHLQKGIYKGHFKIEKDITIIADEGVVLTSDNTKEPILLIENNQNVVIDGLTIKTKGTAIEINQSQNIKLFNLTATNVTAGIKVYQSNDIHIQGGSIEGNNSHYADSGNGIAFYDSKDITVSDNKIKQVQDGVYIESTKNILVNGNTVENSRYGTHFMFCEQVEFQNNHFAKNVTGLMVMMTSTIAILENFLTYQDGFNGTGVTLFDVKDVKFGKNEISGNRVGLTIQRTAQVHAFENTFQMNQTAVESIKSKTTNRIVESVFVGNLVNLRTDELGVTLQKNYFDDYTGIDVDDDGVGDESYVALQSFGQWMVRKPVYQYYVEHPSVVLLNQIDKQTNRGTRNLLVDETPKVQVHTKNRFPFELNKGQLLIGISLLSFCLIIWRRSVYS